MLFALLSRPSLASRVAGSRALATNSRSLSAAALRKMQVGSEPQVLVTAQGEHRPGVLRDLTAHLLESGVSIAASKKVMLQGSFAVMLSLWIPPDSKTPAEMVKYITDNTGKLMGFAVEARLIDQSATKATTQPVQRHLKLSCPQKPGIIKAVSELLKDHDCKMTEIDADTSARSGEIWFEFECTVECTSEDAAEVIKQQIEMWTSSEDQRISFLFDSATTKRYTMGAV